MEDDSRDDLASFITELVLCVRQRIDIPALEQRIAAGAETDTSGIEEALSEVERRLPRKDYGVIPGSLSEPKPIVTKIRELLLSANEPGISAGQKLLWLDMVIGRYFAELLLCLAEEGADVGFLVDMVSQRLRVLSDDQLTSVWDRVCAEVATDARAPLAIDPQVISPEFFSPARVGQDARDAIAQYVVTIKPGLIRSMLKAGESSVPMRVPEVARILTFKSAQGAETILPWEITVARHLRRLGRTWKQLGRDRDEFVALLGIPEGKSQMLDGGESTSAAKEAPWRETTASALQFLLATLESLGADAGTIADALFDYKLGCELFAPGNRESYADRREEELQKEVCKYLLDRGIRAVGTYFGRAETDLVAEDNNAANVVEVKVLRGGKALSGAHLNRWLGQLASYVDQSQSARRGVLLIFNLTDATIVAPRKWLRGRYRIVVVNLHPTSPSRVRAMCTITETSHGLVDVQSTGKPSPKQSGGSKKQPQPKPVAKSQSQRKERPSTAKRRR